jgi:hypothetical protein
MHQYGIFADTDAKVYVDGSASAFIRAMKIAIGEDSNYEEAVERARKSGLKRPWWLGKIVPVSFSTTHKKMLEYTRFLLDRGYIGIHPSFSKLLTSMRTAYENEGTLDKDRTAHDDILDAVRMAMVHFEMERK